MSWLAPAVGTVVVLTVLRDVFHTLLHPAGQGSLSMLVFRSVWTATGHMGDRARSLAGPSAMAGVIALWALLLVLGWALIYWPSLPGGFILASPLEDREQEGIIDAVYFSWVTQTTLGFGDIAPRTELLRILAPLQAMIGFSLFTAAVTWVLSVYPALQRQRSLSGLAFAIRQSHVRTVGAPAGLPQALLATQLQRLAEGLSSLRVDYLQYPSTFYFAAPGASLSIAEAMPYLLSISRAGGLRDDAGVAADELHAQIGLLAEVLSTQFLSVPADDPPAVMRALRRHHGLAETDGAQGW